VTPRISVVIPVRNGMPYLHETLDSVRRQTRKPDEIVVVDNCSTDGTREFLRTQTDVRVIDQPSLVPAPANWTTAARAATGDYVKVLCADDVLLPTCLERQEEVLTRNADCVMTAARRQVIGPDSSLLMKAVGLASLNGVVAGDRALLRGLCKGTNLFGEVAAVMFRTKELQAQLPWPDNAGYATDLAMYAKVLEGGSVYLDRTVLAQFRVTESSWSFSVRSAQARDVITTYSTAIAHRDVAVTRRARFSGVLYAYGRQLLRNVIYLRVGRQKRARHPDVARQ